MGFGILFIGYIIANIFTLTSYSFVGMLLGYFIIFCALLELRKYCPTFLYAIIASVLMLFCSFFECFAGINELLDLGMLTNAGTLKQVFVIIEFIITMTFNFTLLYGIADLARRVDFPEIRTKAYRNMIFVGIFNAYQLFLFMPFEFINKEKTFLMSTLMILLFVYVVVNLALIFKCYAFICPQGQEDMARKPSRFAFVNKIRARNEAKEQESIDYYNKKLEERRNRISNTNNKKHKKK